MPKIVQERPYNGVMQKVARLGLQPLLDEMRSTLSGFELRVLEQKDKNGGAAVRVMIDDAFTRAGGWTITKSGDVDWVKCHNANGTRVCIGVEIQFSARSDLVVMDIIHLRKAITKGVIDIGVLVVPSDRLSNFLTDRAPCMSDAERHITEAGAESLPLLLIALEHDGAGPPLAKRKKSIK